jgi:hypothetical protein
LNGVTRDLHNQKYSRHGCHLARSWQACLGLRVIHVGFLQHDVTVTAEYYSITCFSSWLVTRREVLVAVSQTSQDKTNSLAVSSQANYTD